MAQLVFSGAGLRVDDSENLSFSSAGLSIGSIATSTARTGTASITAVCTVTATGPLGGDEYLYADDFVVALVGLKGSVLDIDEPPGSADSNWLEVI